MSISPYPSRIEKTDAPMHLPTSYMSADWWRDGDDLRSGEEPAPWEDRVDLLARTNPEALEGPPPRPLFNLLVALTKWLVAKDNPAKSQPETGHVARGIDPIRTLHAG